jgi:GR25 family glycosyltransferase involved in LPS biosynthesis
MVTWNGVKIADKGFLINLEERKDRLEECILEFDKNNIVGVERFDAIKITEDSDDGWVIRGCTHSHMEILKKQVENKWEKIIIFEDDFFLDFDNSINDNTLDDIINNINNYDFDCLFLGSVLLSDSKYINKFLLKPNKLVQSTTYIVSLKFSKFVTNHFNYLDKQSVVFGEQIDSYYSSLAEHNHWRINTNLNGCKDLLNHDLNIYFTYPQLFNQRISFSNIENKVTSYLHYNKLRNKQYYPKIKN